MTYWPALEIITQLEMKKFRPQVFVIFVIFLGLNALFPLKIHGQGKLNVRVVQANIGNFLKVASERGDQNSYESINRDYFELSTKETGFNPDLIVWPETAYSTSFYSNNSQVPQIFSDIIQKMDGAEMLIGGYVQDSSKDPFDIVESVFNASVLMSGSRIKTSYHKNILIPFGETLPFGPLNRQIVSVVPAVSLFARGQGTPLMETKDKHRFVTPICYEILESNYMRTLLNQYGGNHFIVNHTNDSWYGDTAEPWQHLFLSKWRALEFQLPIVRSTNTGVSSVIFPDGSESKQLGVGEKNVLDVVVPLGSGEATLYQTWGVWPMLILVALFFALTIVREKYLSSEKS
jgi:apolipoprotein N-acyltransferase